MDIDAERGASVFLVISGRSAPIVVSGTIVENAGGRLVLDLQESPSYGPADDEPAAAQATSEKRGSARYPTWLDATVFSAATPAGRPAVVTDLSIEGASVETDAWAGDAFYRLAIEAQGESLQVECEVIQQEATWRGVLLHTRFVLLNQQQYDFLDSLVAALRNVFGEYQESLASDRIGAVHA